MRPLLLATMLLAPFATHAAPSLAIGAPFPVLSLPLCGTEDEESSIMEFRGQKLMLHLFASW